MKKLRFLIAALLLVAAFGYFVFWPRFSGTHGAEAIEDKSNRAYLYPDHQLWQQVLNACLDKDQNVAYEKIQGPVKDALNAYVAQIAEATPAQFKTDDERLAYYLNAYNALVVKGVLDYWPIESVRDVGEMSLFFRERVYVVAGTKVSLHGFESKVIRKYDPRLHFALNCASISCPKLSRQAFTPETLERQLGGVTHAFINDLDSNFFDKDTNTWHLSKIFEWYEADFGGKEGVRAILDQYRGTQTSPDVNFVYFDYDWGLNLSKGDHSEEGDLGTQRSH